MDEDWIITRLLFGMMASMILGVVVIIIAEIINNPTEAIIATIAIVGGTIGVFVIGHVSVIMVDKCKWWHKKYRERKT